MKGFLFGAGFLLLGFIVVFVYHWIKALKDPEVQIAAELRMSVLRYHKYENLYNDHWEVMMKYGANSKQAEEYFAKVTFPELKKLDMDEWRRYQDFRTQVLQKQMIEEMFGA